MKKASRIVIGVVIGAVVFLCLAAAGLALGLVFGLGLNNNYNNKINNDTFYENTASMETTTEQTTTTFTTPSPIVQNFVNNVIFPNGSYVIPLSNLSTDTSAQAPAIVNISVLTQIGLKADPTNDVLVSGRKTFLYIAVPSQQSSTTNRKRRNALDTGLCVEFGNSNNCHMVPYGLQSKGLGFVPVTQLFNGETLYQLPITAPSSMCPSSSDSQCVSVPYQAYVISSDSRSPASEPSILYAACGSQCQGEQGTCKQSCQACNNETVSGADTPVTRRYHMKAKISGSFQFVYETFGVPDRMRIYQGDALIFDSGCLGTLGERRVTVTFTSFSDEIRVDVEPNCTGTLGTAWFFRVGCPSTN